MESQLYISLTHLDITDQELGTLDGHSPIMECIELVTGHCLPHFMEELIILGRIVSGIKIKVKLLKQNI